MPMKAPIWINKVKIKIEELEKEEFRKKVQSDKFVLEEHELAIMKFLNYSLISGEYIGRTDLISESYINYFLVTGAKKEINTAFQCYNDFTNNINSHITVIADYKNPESTFYKTKRINLRNKISNLSIIDETKSEFDCAYRLFLINLSLSDFDEYFEISEEHRRELGIYEEELKHIIAYRSNSIIYKVVLDKCEFLKAKIDFRDNKTDDLRSDNLYKSFWDKTKIHYSKSEELDKTIEKNNFKIADIHRINKFIRKNKTSKYEKKAEQLDLYIGWITSKLNNSKVVEVDKISYESAINLLKNSKIRILLDEEKDKSFSTILSYITDKKTPFIKNNIILEIEEFIKNDNKYNYLGFEKIVNFFKKAIERLEQNDDYLNFLDGINDFTDDEITSYKNTINFNINTLKELYKNALDKLDTSIDEFRKLNLKPIYLPFDECIIENAIKVGDDKLNLFLDSSYILPVNFEKTIKEIELNRLEFPFEIKLIKAQISNKIAYFLNENHLNKEKDDLKKTIKENEFKTVQIVAMFVTIATFILINVRLFDNKSALESFAILIGLGGVMVLFNAFFNWMIIGQIYAKDKIVKKDHTIFIFIISISLVILSLLLLTRGKEETFKEKLDKTLKSEIDTIVKERLDSIKKYEKDSLKTEFKIIDLRLKNVEKK
jgi:hypothetical protein